MGSFSAADHPIGIFDSGLGGLTVVKEVIRALPCEDIVYFGDTARVPYGTKSRESIVRFSRENVDALMAYGIKMVVVACNTASSLALPVLKRACSFPVTGVTIPGAKKAVTVTRNKKIGVIATSSTVQSGKYAAVAQRLDPEVEVISQACPLFVPLAEEGWFDRPETCSIAEHYLAPLKRAGVDCVILGCTHYPLLKNVIQKVMGPDVVLIDSAEAVAEDVRGILKRRKLLREGSRRPKYQFLVSDEPGRFRNLAKQFLGFDVNNVKRCDHV